MASRETLPRGASLLALAGGTTAAEVPSPAPTTFQPAATRQIALARQTAVKPLPEEIATIAVATPIPVRIPKQKLNARISATLLDEVRDCVVALSGPPHGLTMDQFAEEAYRRELERLRRTHAAGESFARRPYNPRPGRRVA